MSGDKKASDGEGTKYLRVVSLKEARSANVFIPGGQHSIVRAFCGARGSLWDNSSGSVVTTELKNTLGDNESISKETFDSIASPVSRKLSASTENLVLAIEYAPFRGTKVDLSKKRARIERAKKERMSTCCCLVGSIFMVCTLIPAVVIAAVLLGPQETTLANTSQQTAIFTAVVNHTYPCVAFDDCRCAVQVDTIPSCASTQTNRTFDERICEQPGQCCRSKCKKKNTKVYGKMYCTQSWGTCSTYRYFYYLESEYSTTGTTKNRSESIECGHNEQGCAQSASTRWSIGGFADAWLDRRYDTVSWAAPRDPIGVWVAVALLTALFLFLTWWSCCATRNVRIMARTFDCCVCDQDIIRSVENQENIKVESVQLEPLRQVTVDLDHVKMMVKPAKLSEEVSRQARLDTVTRTVCLHCNGTGRIRRNGDQKVSGMACLYCDAGAIEVKRDRSFVPTEADQDLCQICYTNPSQYGVSTECTHFYCKECLQHLLKAMLEQGQFPAYCPMCRADVKGGGEPEAGRIEGPALSFLAQRRVITREFQLRFVKAAQRTSQAYFQCPAKCGNLLKAADAAYFLAKDGKAVLQTGRCVCGAQCCLRCHELVKSASKHKCKAKVSRVKVDAATQKLMSRLGKACPMCGMFVQVSNPNPNPNPVARDPRPNI